jgi:hypothetical protein
MALRRRWFIQISALSTFDGRIVVRFSISYYAHVFTLVVCRMGDVGIKEYGRKSQKSPERRGPPLEKVFLRVKTIPEVHVTQRTDDHACVSPPPQFYVFTSTCCK